MTTGKPKALTIWTFVSKVMTLLSFSFELFYFILGYSQLMEIPGCPTAKEPPAIARRFKRCRSDPWVGKISWRRKWQPTPVFLHGKSRGQRSLVGCSPGSQRVGHDWVCNMRGLGRRKRNLENWRPDIIAEVFSIKPRKSWRKIRE